MGRVQAPRLEAQINPTPFRRKLLSIEARAHELGWVQRNLGKQLFAMSILHNFCRCNYDSGSKSLKPLHQQSETPNKGSSRLFIQTLVVIARKIGFNFFFAAEHRLWSHFLRSWSQPITVLLRLFSLLHSFVVFGNDNRWRMSTVEKRNRRTKQIDRRFGLWVSLERSIETVLGSWIIRLRPSSHDCNCPKQFECCVTPDERPKTWFLCTFAKVRDLKFEIHPFVHTRTSSRPKYPPENVN